MKINIPSGAGGGGSGTVTSLTATAPVVITPSPTTATGVISAPTAVTSAAALTANALVKGAGLQASAASAVATDDGTTLTYTGTGGVLASAAGGLKAGANGGAAGVVTLNGSTSGSFTETADATGANVTFSGNGIFPNGSAGNPSVVVRTGFGIHSPSSTTLGLATNATGNVIGFYGGSTQIMTMTLGAANIAIAAAPTPCNIFLNSNLTTGVSQAGLQFGNNSSFTATANGQFMTENRGTFAPTSGTANFAGLICSPTINQTGGASGTIRCLAAYPINTAVVGTEYLLALGTSSAVGPGGTLTDRFLVDSNGVTTELTANGATWIHGQASELLTLSTSGLTTDTSANLLPAGAIIEAVCCRVTTTITTTTNWAVGDPTTAARFSAANATLTSGTTSIGIDCWSGAVTTLAAGPSQAAAAKVRITCTGSNPGAGVIRITVFYRQFVAPTS